MGILCRSKDQGGLGIQNVALKNVALLSKWLFKILTEEGVWLEILKNKYMKGRPLTTVTVKPRDSQFWKGLMKVKDQFLQFGTFSTKSGVDIRFWEDRWVGQYDLKGTISQPVSHH